MAEPLRVDNAGFDPPFIEQGGISQLKVAGGWGFVWKDGPDSGHGFLVRPECYPKELPDEDTCQGIQTTSATHQAAFMQALVLPPRAKNLVLEARVAYHAPAGGMAVKVGIDGTGQTGDMYADTIQWGSWLNQDGDPPWEAGKFVVAKAFLPDPQTGYASLWLYSQNKWRGKNNHVFWLDVNAYIKDGPPDPDPATAAEKIMAAVDLLLESVALL